MLAKVPAGSRRYINPSGFFSSPPPGRVVCGLESFEDGLRQMARQESGGASWLEWCIAQGIYQKLNEELVEGLARVLRESAEGEILEVGAGRGELAGWLALRGLQVRPTDPAHSVEKLTASAALRLYRPHTVLVCWPPADADVYASIFRAPSVRNVVAIDHGREWLAAAPEGWEVIPLDALNRYSLCRFDFLDRVWAGRLVQHSRLYRIART